MAHNLLYLFDRPLEPVFMEKGANKVKFDVPHNLVSDRYAGNPDIIERFGTDSSERIPVRSNISIPNLKVPMSLFIPRHRRIASHLINIFMGLKSVDDLQTVAVYARDRLNPYLFNYAMSVALFHRPDTKDLNLPLLIETFPEKYVDSKVFRQLREEATVVPDGQRMPIIIPRDYTASDLEPEHRLWYFREDIGINLHHWHWHLVYPFEAANNAIVNKDRREIGWGKRVQVELKRELGASFGVCIVGGTVNISNDAQQISGIFIKNIIKSSPAELCKQIKVGDRILAVNEYDVRKATQEQAINLIKNAGSTIKLDIQSFDLSNIPNKTKMNKSVDVNNEKAPYETSTQSNDVQKTTTTKSSDGESSNDDDSEEEDSLGKVLTKAGKEIDRKSAGNVRRSKEEARADDEPENEYGYTDKKIKKRYGNLGNIIRVKINRSNNSMGIALAGHRNRNEMGCFIAGLNPKGAASSANLNIGDEILEINGIVLHKMCHLNASVLIKGIPGAILEFIVLRKDTALDILAVKAVTNFPAAFDQLDHLHSCYKNVRTASIQKNGPSLGIMIIEGKHSELGQGIFISDIQDGSNADKAGLLIGEMILAVNKDLLVDCNYDAAAALLKRAEGIVTLIVCNPNKKDDKKEEILKTPAKAEKKDGTEKAEKPKDEGPPADPSIAKVASNKESIIEINTNNKGLGLFVAGGKMLQPPVDGAYVVYIYPNGAASSDKRLQLFDKIIEVEGKKITADMSYTDLKKVFKRRYLVVTGSPTAFDNRLIVGDMITSINGESVRNASFVDCVLLIKSSQSRLVLKVSRPTNKN